MGERGRGGEAGGHLLLLEGQKEKISTKQGQTENGEVGAHSWFTCRLYWGTWGVPLRARMGAEDQGTVRIQIRTG